jgi:penicillin-binding protein 2
MVVAALALEQKVDVLFDCPAAGFVPAPGRAAIRDHEYYEAQRNGRTWGGQGRIGLGRALTKSSNVYFAQLGAHLGVHALEAQARRFQFNQSVTLLEGSAGALRVKPGSLPAQKPGDRGAAAQLAIGQGALLASPMGMALATAALANDGRMVKPRLSPRQTPELLGGVAPPAIARKMRGLLRDVVTQGTGRGADVQGLHVAGKTGTAQVRKIAGSQRGQSGEWKYRDHGLFICFAPVEAPRYAAAVVIEHGLGGARAAAPVAKDFLTWLYDPAKAMAALDELERGWGGDINQRMAAERAQWKAAHPQGTKPATTAGKASDAAAVVAEKAATAAPAPAAPAETEGED